jgi:hypothetical protein
VVPGTPPSGYEFPWCDSTALFPRWKNSAATTFQAAKEITGVRYGNGPGAVDTIAASANIAALWTGTGCSTSTNALLVSGNCGASGGSSALSAITAATGTNTIANGNNSGQVWNWALTSNTVTAMTFGETTAATGTSDQLVAVTTTAGSTAVPLTVTNSLTGSQTVAALKITPTWNTTGVVDAGILENVTNTASGAASLLMDLQVGGTSEFKVDKTGLGTFTSGVQTGTPPSCTPGSAGTLCLGEGTAPTAASAVDQIYADSTSHSFAAQVNGGGKALLALVVGSVHQTAQTASISTATLCAASAGACNQAGQYHVHLDFIETGTACSSVTAGSVTFALTYTDSNGTAHSALIVPLLNQTGATSIAQGNSFTFATSLANAGASGDITISTNGSVIQYATTYTACTTGTGTYQLDAAVTRLQ